MGNFHGRSVLNASLSLSDFCELRGLIEEEFEHSLEINRQKLFSDRESRPRPFRDDKILSAWNGSMIMLGYAMRIGRQSCVTRPL